MEPDALNGVQTRAGQENVSAQRARELDCIL